MSIFIIKLDISYFKIQILHDKKQGNLNFENELKVPYSL